MLTPFVTVFCTTVYRRPNFSMEGPSSIVNSYSKIERQACRALGRGWEYLKGFNTLKGQITFYIDMPTKLHVITLNVIGIIPLQQKKNSFGMFMTN